MQSTNLEILFCSIVRRVRKLRNTKFNCEKFYRKVVLVNSDSVAVLGLDSRFFFIKGELVNKILKSFPPN